jgi:hypothetical protein
MYTPRCSLQKGSGLPQLRIRNYAPRWLMVHATPDKRQELPLAETLYEALGLLDSKGPLFRMTVRGTKQLSRTVLPRFCTKCVPAKLRQGENRRGTVGVAFDLTGCQ